MFRGLLLMLCACALLAPAAAAAAQDEIFVDPGSPSGKEYALPIDSARRQAARDAGSTSSKKAPLFGEGVDTRDAGSAAGGGGGSDAGGSSGDGAAPRGGKAGTPRSDADGGSPVTTRAQAASPDGGLGTVAFVGAGAAVLLLGGAIGLMLRRRSARTT